MKLGYRFLVLFVSEVVDVLAWVKGRYVFVSFFLVKHSVPQLERCSRRGKRFFQKRPKFLGWSTFRWVLCWYQKKKVIVPNWLLFSEFSVDLQKRKMVIAPNWSTFFRILCCFPKKKTPVWNCRKGKESLDRHVGQFGGRNFCSRGRRPLLPLPSCGPASTV